MRHRALPSPFQLILAASLVLSLILAQPALSSHAGADEEKTGILLVAFGTSVPEAQAAIEALHKDAQAAFPGVDVRLAYSSKTIRDKLAATGEARRSPAQALADMAAEGFTRVAVQSLHAIPGREFEDIRATAELFREMPKGIRKIAVGRPLLFGPQDIRTAAAALLPGLPRHARGEAVLLMGHGTAHPANAAYAALQLELWKRDRDVFVATVEGAPTLDDILPELKRRGVRTAFLVPLMSVAGDHAHNDMAGSGPDSWSGRLAAAGITAKPVLVGLGSRPELAALWTAHLRDAMRELGD